MRCPFCGADETQVKDSRPTEESAVIRRRRACLNCGARFTTFERVQLRELTVLKQNGKREPLDRAANLAWNILQPLHQQGERHAGNDMVERPHDAGFDLDAAHAPSIANDASYWAIQMDFPRSAHAIGQALIDHAGAAKGIGESIDQCCMRRAAESQRILTCLAER